MVDIILLHALYATATPINKYLLGLTTPMLLASMRMLVSGILLCIYHIRVRSYVIFHSSHVRLIVQVIVVGVYIKYMLKYWALAHMPAIKMALIIALSPFITSTAVWISQRESITRLQRIGLIIGFIGIVPIMCAKSQALCFVGYMCVGLPELAIFSAVLANCYSMIRMRTLIREHAYPPSLLNGICSFSAGLLGLLSALSLKSTVVVHDVTHFMSFFAVLIIVSNIICKNLYLRLLKRYSLTFVSFTDFLNPIFVAFYSYVWLGEVVAWQHGLACLLIGVGLFIFYRDELINTKGKIKNARQITRKASIAIRSS